MMLRRVRALVAVLATILPSALAQQDTFQGVARIVAIGDLHGDYDAAIEALRLGGLIDAKNKWSGGKTHLVQTGDIPDRGPDTRKIIDLMMNLEKQAKKAGGAVHMLIGNHEAMNMYGDLRYTTKEEFTAFQKSDSPELREAYYQRLLEQSKPTDEGVFKKKFDTETPLGFVEQRQAWAPKGEIGKWVLSHNAIVKINETLFLHGGISPRVAEMKLDQINKTIREELTDSSKLQGGLTMAEDGPLWYRGLVNDPEDKAAPNLETVLKSFGVARIVVGHTPTKAPIQAKLNGRLIDIDTGMSRVFGGPRDCLVIEGDKLYSMAGGKKTPLN
jgi:hypothetical protein